MKKIVNLLLACMMLVACDRNTDEPDEPDEPKIPLETMDAVFRLYLLENFDLNGDEIISEEEAALVKEIRINGIHSLEGIQYFPNLEILDISYNGNFLFTIDLSHNTALKSLYCDYCDVRQLDVSENHALETLSCRSRPGMVGELNSLTINPELKFLNINGHKMTSLDFSGNKFLKELYCQSTTLTNLNVSQSVLEILDCSGPQLDLLNINDCTSLKEITCEANSLSFVASNCSSLERVYAFGLRQLYVSDSPLLKILECWFVGIQSISFSDNPELEVLKVGGRFILFDLSNNFQLVDLELSCTFEGNRNLDLSNCKKLKSFVYSGSELESINFNGCTMLEDVDIRVSIESLNFAACSALKSLKCRGGLIRELNLQGCNNLAFLYCGGNQLTELDLKDCTELIELWCFSNYIKELDLGECKKLTYLDCSNNQMTNLKINSDSISIVHCERNALTELVIIDGIQLEQLFCFENNLSSLDLTGCLSLEELDCKSNNHLEYLNITDCKALKSLYCFFGSLTQLDVSNCPALTYLHCSNNRLQPSLDVSKCLALKELNCHSNPDLIELIINRYNSIQVLNKDSQTQIVLAD